MVDSINFIFSFFSINFKLVVSFFVFFFFLHMQTIAFISSKDLRVMLFPPWRYEI